MRNQYHDTISEKQRKAAHERARDEEAARNNARMNAEAERFEREQLNLAKREYDQILNN